VNFNPKILQIDDEGNEVRSFDTRMLRVVERQEYSAPRQGQRGDFNIVDRVPKGGKDEIPSMLSAPDTTITFSCTRYDYDFKKSGGGRALWDQMGEIVPTFHVCSEN
jgi:hypothetical protein